MRGIGETGAELRDVLPTEGRLHENLDLVRNKHQVPGLEIQIDATGGIGDHQGVAAQEPQHPDGVGHLLIGVALVVVLSLIHILGSASAPPP